MTLPIPLLALALVACHPQVGDSTDTRDSGTPAQDTSLRPEGCDRYNTTGSFELHYEQGWASFSGTLNDSVSPQTMDLLIDGGDCELYGWEYFPDCDPSCVGEEICGYDDACHPWPSGLDLGILRVTGTEPELSLEPNAWNGYEYPESWSDPYQTGDTITLSVDGSDEVEAFTLSTLGAPPLDKDRFEVTMRAGGPMTVSWEPAGAPDDLRMRATLSIDHHATLPRYAVCEVSDARGAFEVSAAIVDGLIEAGATGIGTYVESSRLRRGTQAWGETSRGCALFETYSEMWFDVETEP